MKSKRLSDMTDEELKLIVDACWLIIRGVSMIEEDGTLFLELPVDVTKVKRVIIRQEGTDIGNVYYLDDECYNEHTE